jgi:alpha-galactosidase
VKRTPWMMIGVALAALCGPLAAATAAAADPLTPTGKWSANTDGSAPVPPMGWNSWNAFNSDVDEEKVLASAQALVDTKLRDIGYRYVNIDDGWWLKRRQPDGRLLIRTSHFPSAATGADTSFRPLTDRLHAMGLKAGIYSDIGRNSCGQIYTPDFKNQPEGTVAEREVGLYGHVDQDIRLFFAEWNFDFIKVDGCGARGLPADAPRVKSGLYRALTPLVDMQSLGGSDVAGIRGLYEQVHTALHTHAGDRPYVYSLCLWGAGDVRAWGKDVGNTSRTSDDIQPVWPRMLTNLDTVTHRALCASGIVERPRHAVRRHRRFRRGTSDRGAVAPLAMGNGQFAADHRLRPAETDARTARDLRQRGHRRAEPGSGRQPGGARL